MAYCLKLDHIFLFVFHLSNLAKFTIKILDGSHQQGDAVSKQLNDKERRYAAMENPDIERAIKNACRLEGDYDD